MGSDRYSILDMDSQAFIVNISLNGVQQQQKSYTSLNYKVHLFVCLFVFETGFLCVALAALELRALPAFAS